MTEAILPGQQQSPHAVGIKVLDILHQWVYHMKPNVLPSNLEALLANFELAKSKAEENEIFMRHANFMGIQLLQEWFTGDEATDGQLEQTINAALPYSEDPALMQQGPPPVELAAAPPAETPPIQEVAPIEEAPVQEEPTPALQEASATVAEAPLVEVPPVEQQPAVEQQAPVEQAQQAPTQAQEAEVQMEALKADAEVPEVPVYIESADTIQIAVKTAVLVKLIQKVERAIQSKVVRDIEKYIYFEFTESSVIARATNGRYMAESELPAVVNGTPQYQLIGKDSIEICFLGSMIIPLTKKLTSEDMLITINSNDTATIESNSSEMIIHTLAGDQFDLPKRLEGDVTSVLLPIDYMANMYQAVLYAVADKAQKPTLLGVHHCVTAEGVVLTAADGARMARQTFNISLQEEVHEELECVIPKETIAEILKLMVSSEDQNVELLLSDSRMEFRLSDTVIYSTLIEGKFPSVEKMVNEESEHFIDIPLRDLKESLVFTSMFEDGNGKIMMLLINPGPENEEGQLRITTPATEKGKYTQDVIIRGEGSEMTVQLNFKYLGDALKKYPDTTVIRFMYMSERAPILIKDANADKGSFDILLPIISPQSGMKAVINKFKVKNKFQAFKINAFDGLE